MTAQEAITKIKALFEATPMPPQNAPTNFAEYSLADGTKVMIDNLAQGGNVTMLDSSNVEVPVPAGDYTLADGTIISVDANGVITNIVTPAQDPAQAPADPTAMLEQRLNELQARVDALTNGQSSAISQFEEQLAKHEERMNALKDVIVTAFQTPSVKPTEEPVQKFKHIESKDEKINRFLEKVKSFNKN